MIVEIKEVSENNIYDLRTHTHNGYVLNIDDGFVYYIDREKNLTTFIGEKDWFSEYKAKESNCDANGIPEDFVLKVLEISLKSR